MIADIDERADAMDDLDQRLIAELRVNARASIPTLAALLGVARGTVQARLDKLSSTGVITSWGPDLSPAALGYPCLLYTSPSPRDGLLSRMPSSA